MGQGRENVKTFLEENPDISAAIEISIRESAGLKIDPSLIKDKANSKPQITEEIAKVMKKRVFRSQSKLLQETTNSLNNVLS